MKTKVAVAVFGLALLGGLLAASQSSQPVEHAFSKGGTIRLDLEAADYRIAGTPDDKISVRWHADDAEQMARARGTVEVRGTAAVIRTVVPKHKNTTHFEIDVPQRADLDITLSAGDITIRGVEGNKSLSMWAGDVIVDVGQADLYRKVDATVRFGDITARPFNLTRSGIFRSIHWTGSGKYSLIARLFAGDLNLR